jgi:hypothetical protein
MLAADAAAILFWCLPLLQQVFNAAEARVVNCVLLYLVTAWGWQISNTHLVQSAASAVAAVALPAASESNECISCLCSTPAASIEEDGGCSLIMQVL